MKLFVITIDTEADYDANWVGRSPESYSNIAALRETLLPATDTFGAPVTLLLSGDVTARDEPAGICDALRRDQGWELGTHLHGEFTAPEKRYDSPAGVTPCDFQCGYSDDLEKAKLETLSGEFQSRYGFAPTSFRAGRYGAGPRTFRILLQLGYEVDTSVVPRAIFREGDSVADFRQYGVLPMIAAREEQGASLVEIPVSVRPSLLKSRATAYSRRISEALTSRGRSGGTAVTVAVMRKTAQRLMGKLRRSLWLRPSYSSEPEMRGILRWLARQEVRGPIVANMMFHSNELAPGASPYNATAGDVEAFMARLSGALGCARELGFEFASLTDASRRVRGLLP